MQSVLQRQKPKAFQGSTNCCAIWMLEPKEPETMSVKEINKLEDHYQESQEEEVKTKQKQVNWLHILAPEHVKFVSIMCNALSNNHIGMLENPVVCKLKLIKIVPN